MCSDSRAKAHFTSEGNFTPQAHHVPEGNTSFQKEKPSDWMVFFLVAGVALNFVGFIRNIVYYYAGKKGKVNKVLTIAFTALMCAMGTTVSLLAEEGWYFILSVVALTINTYAMSFANPNNIRKSILITSPLVLIYDCFVFSVGGAVYESVAIISAIIGLIRSSKHPA